MNSVFMIKILRSRENIPLFVAGSVLLAVVFAWLAPAEATLGEAVKLVYVHAALMWVGFALSTSGGVAGVAYLFRRKDALIAWSSGAAVNNGWFVKDAAENSGSRQRGRFRSRETGTAAQRPALDVTYLRADSALSTATVGVGSYGQIAATFTHNGGAGADQISQVSFVIPADWSDISTSTADYAVTAPAGKTWNVTTAPAGPTGPQTVTVTSAGGAFDLANGEAITITFNVRAPWLSGNSVWPFTVIGAAGGSHLPASRTIAVTGTTLDFTPSADTSLSPMTLSGADATATGNLGTLNVRDGRGSGNGWSVVVASTDFIMSGSPAEIIPAGGFFIPVAPPVNIISGTAPPTSAAGSVAGAGLTLMNAGAGFGVGHYEVVPDLELLIPAQTLVGTYEATVTETIIGL